MSRKRRRTTPTTPDWIPASTTGAGDSATTPPASQPTWAALHPDATQAPASAPTRRARRNPRRKTHATTHPRRHRGYMRRHWRGRGPWRLTALAVIAALFMFGGLNAATYPHAASWFDQVRQSNVIRRYEASVDRAEPGRREQLANAHAYNEALVAGAVYKAGSNVPTEDSYHEPTGVDYWHQLRADGDGLMARLKIPAIRLDLPIYHGTSEETLLKGLGHLRGTALPVGGEGTRSVITGHRGLAESQLFTYLDKVDKGDTFTIEVFGEVLTYKVIEIQVVRPKETKAIEAVPGRDLVTLVTCTPLGINTHRILVTGERIIPTPAKDIAAKGADPDVPGFPWWAVLYGLGIDVLILYLRWAGYALAPRRPRQVRTSRRRGGKPGRRLTRRHRAGDGPPPTGRTPADVPRA